MGMYMRNKGFTLIEVLISLAILSIALTAIIKFTSQHIRDTAYIQNKTIANWVGLQIINEARVGLLKLSHDNTDQEIEMLGQMWPWKASMTETPNKHIKEINVEVFQKPNKKPLLKLTSYVYVN